MTLEACARLVERGDPRRYRVALAAPPAAREALFPLYAYNLEVARAPQASREPLIAEMRLQWWRDALAEAAAGGAPPAHEVAGPLARLVRDRGLDVAPLLGMAEARRRDILREPFGAEELRGYLRGTGGNLMRASAAALGEDREEAAGAGFAAAAASWLLALPVLEVRGEGLLDPSPGKVLRLAEEGLAALAEARAVRFGAAVPALRAATAAGAVLRRAARDPAAAAGGRLAPFEGTTRARLLWAALRGTW